ncbi:hypothetical protein Tco_0880953, partial [Tanacetum coccineum]
ERLTLLTPKKKALVVHSCQRDPKAPPMTLLNQDLFYLKHERTSRWERVHDIQLGMESYQQKVNLPAPTITFLSIEKEELFTITSEPVVSMIYENNKKEKRVMIHKEIHKFCDATLKRVLKGLEKYNKDVKYGYADPSPNDADAKYLQFYKEDIRECIKHRDHMRQDSSGFRIYNCKTRKIMEMIHVKFDELTTMVTERNNLEPDSNHSLFDDSSVEPMSTNSAAPNTSNTDDTSSSTIIIVHADEAPHIVSTSEEQSPPKSNDIADEPNQEDNVELDGNTFFNPFCTPVSKEVGSSLRNIDPSNMHEFYQTHLATHKWTKAHPLEQVIGDPSKPVMTQSKLTPYVEICMYALTVCTTEPKSIKEAMQDHSWIEAIQEELHQL